MRQKNSFAPFALEVKHTTSRPGKWRSKGLIREGQNNGDDQITLAGMKRLSQV